MEPEQLEQLIRDIRQQRCVLLLGPRIASVPVNGHWQPLVEGLSEYLAGVLDQYQLPYDATPSAMRNLPYIAQQLLSHAKVRRVDLEDITRDFLREKTQEIPAVYQSIAELPIKLILNTTPDDYITRALREAGKQPISLYYNFQVTQNSKRIVSATPIRLEDISTTRPLVYNLFGAQEDPESLVLTEDDQMEFIRNVVKGDPPIPDEIRGQFDHRKTYLFLGFNMEHWQFRLLLDSLNLKPENTTLTPQADNYPLTSVTRTFYERRFNFRFIEKRIDAFVHELSSQLKAAPSKKQKIVLSYCDKDESYLLALENNLKLWEQEERASLWHRGRILPGQDREQVSEAAFQEADAILLLISAHYFNDPLILEQELEWAIAAQEERGARLFPIIARPCQWRIHRDLRRLDPLPDDGTPLESNKWASRDEAYHHIIEQLQKRLSQ
ncbi:MAG: toll/interleukin-1 receptor domain-containing protein [Phaeodactylibacter sp.]|nr:toll/interleukin-1 receptor domain-containing protein [Phaeodactylibacter sp.]MCB9050123.1 toll/interleukin-1 receptor domain-containing protein [Lewinellaceae bacterium]